MKATQTKIIVAEDNGKVWELLCITKTHISFKCVNDNGTLWNLPLERYVRLLHENVLSIQN